MSVVFPKKLLFLDHPRTGSTAVTNALVRIGGKPYKRHTLKMARVPLKVCVIRDPWDLVVSWWLVISRRVNNYPTLLSFLTNYKHPHFDDPYYFAPICNRLIDYYTLEVELNLVLSEANLPNVKLQIQNTTFNKRPFEEYYTQETWNIVKERYYVSYVHLIQM